MPNAIACVVCVCGFKYSCRVPVCLETQLTRANAWMARLDLVAETFAPICVALIVGYASKSAYVANLIGFVLVATWNWLTAPVEYVLLRRIYASQSGLQTSKSSSTADSEQAGMGNALSNAWELFSYGGSFHFVSC